MNIRNLKFFGIIFVILLAFYSFFIVATIEKSAWDLDFHFTERVFTTNSLEGDDVLNSVIDIIQVFSINDSKNDFLSINKLNKRGELILETRSSFQITAIMDALHEKSDINLKCNEERLKKTMHILGYDQQLMKVAYFLSYPCMSNQGYEISALVVPDRSLGLSVFYSKSFGKAVFNKGKK